MIALFILDIVIVWHPFDILIAYYPFILDIMIVLYSIILDIVMYNPLFHPGYIQTMSTIIISYT